MFSRLLPFLLLGAASLVQAVPVYPGWWLTEGVVTSQPPLEATDPTGYATWMASNYAVANLGQAKNLAKAAYETMNDAEPGSAGTVIQGMVTAFSMDSEVNQGALNLGQLKAISAPFYERMHEKEFTVTLADGTVIASGEYPWNPATPVSENYALANLGQLKHVFSFSLEGWPPPPPDSDIDGMPDAWEQQIVDADPYDDIESIEDVLPSGPYGVASDFDGDGLTNLEEYLWGTNPVVAGVALNFYDGFDLYVEGTNWNSSGGPAIGVVTGSGANSTSKYLQLAASSSNPFFLEQEYRGKSTDVWLDFYLKGTTAGSLPQLLINDNALLRFGNTGEVEVYNNYNYFPVGGETGRWMTVTSPSAIDSWKRFTLHLEFGTKSWELFIDGVQVAENLGLNVEVAACLYGLSFQSDGTGNYQLDELRVQKNTNLLAFIDQDGDGLTDSSEIAGFSSEYEYDTDFDLLGDSFEDSSSINDFSDTKDFVQADSLLINFANYISNQSIDGQELWAGDSGSTIDASASPSETKALLLDDSTASLNLASYGLERFYLNTYAKLQKSDSLPSGITVEGLIFHYELDANGDLNVWRESDWDTQTGVDLSDTWHSYSVGLDFQARTWDLYVDGELIFSQIPFLDPTLRSLEVIDFFDFSSNTTGLTSIDLVYIDRWPLLVDRDSDDLPDWWEQVHFGNLYESASGDFDHDGYTNLAEFNGGFDPTNWDENLDGIPDGFSAPVSVDQTTDPLPFEDDFEDSFNTTYDNWNLEGNALGTLVDTTSHGGTYSLKLNASSGVGSLTHYFALDPVYSVWIDYYIKPALLTTVPGIPSNANQSAICFVDGDDGGTLQYYDGKYGWVESGAAPVDGNDWVRITVYQNFLTQTWSIYQDDVRVVEGANFSNAAPFFCDWALDVFSSDYTYIDDLSISEDEPNGLDNDGDGLVNFAYDVNGNGILDVSELNSSEDRDHDGFIDIDEDIDHDGHLDVNEDIDGDGHLDVNEDLNGNGDLDSGEDLDDDGNLDVDEDLDSDGKLDFAEDYDGDGKLDVAETDPNNWDTDGDYISDGDDIDPLDPDATGSYSKLPVKYGFDAYSLGSLDETDAWEAGVDVDVVVDPNDANNHYLSIDGVAANLTHLLSPLDKQFVYITFDANLALADNLTTFDVSALDPSIFQFLLALDDVNGTNTLAAYDATLEEWVYSSSGIDFDNKWHSYQIAIDVFLGVWTLSVDGFVLFENMPLRDPSIQYYGVLGLSFPAPESGSSILIDNLTIAHDHDMVFDAPSPLPISESFASYADNDVLTVVDPAWEITGSGSAVVVDSVDSYDDDSRLLSLTGGTTTEPVLLKREVEAQDGFVTVSMAIKPVYLSEAPVMAAGALVDFYFDSSGALFLSDGVYWRELEGYDFASIDWYALRFMIDIDDQSWRLDINDQTVAQDLAVANPEPNFHCFTLAHRASSALLVDAINISRGAPPLVSLTGLFDGSNDLVLQRYFLTNSTTGFFWRAAIADPDDSTFGFSGGTKHAEFLDGTGSLLDEENIVIGVVKMDFATGNVAGPASIYVRVTDGDGYSTLSMPIDFNVSLDGDSDTLPDAWEINMIGDTTTLTDANGDYDLDSLTNAEELAMGSDPNDYYNWGHPALEIQPVITILSGDGQSGIIDTILANPVVLLVCDQNGNKLGNAPIHLTPQLSALLGLESNLSDGASPLSINTEPIESSDGPENDGTVTLYIKPL